MALSESDYQDETTAISSLQSLSATPLEPTQAAKNQDRETEIDEIMEFLRFSIKPTSAFTGTIQFQFKDANSEKPLSYAVKVSKSRDVIISKNAVPQEITCKVTLSVEDFLWIYSGKASGTDIAKLFYSGKLVISGFAFRKVSSFASSFDFSSEKWSDFYKQKKELQMEPGIIAHEPKVSEKQGPLVQMKLSRLRQLQWEMFLEKSFGIEHSVRHYSLSSQLESKKAKYLFGYIHDTDPESDVMKRMALALPRDLKVHREPTIKILETTLIHHLNDEYIDKLRSSVRVQKLGRNRVDIADAGMAQLERALRALGKEGPNRKRMRSKHVPALELLIREFRIQATNLVNRAVGRRSLEQIPCPNIEHVLCDLISPDSLAYCHTPNKNAVIDAIRGLDHESTHVRRHIASINVRVPMRGPRNKTRNLDYRKQLLRQKLESLQLTMIQKQRRQAALMSSQTEDHENLILSDYV